MMRKHLSLLPYTAALAALAVLPLTACQPSPTQQASIEFRPTGNPLDLAIEDVGRSFFVLIDQAGVQYFTRDGSFKQDAAGVVVHTKFGHALVPRMTLTSNMTNIAISARGEVTARRQDTNNVERVGEISLAQFSNPGALTPVAGGLYTASPGSGAASMGQPGRSGFGGLLQGHLEVPAP
jgi:flagellar basal-body rod protein FlgG